MFDFFARDKERKLVFNPNAIIPSASIDSVLDTRYILNDDIEVSLAVGKLQGGDSDVLAIQDFSVNPRDMTASIVRFLTCSKGPFIDFALGHSEHPVSFENFLTLTNTKQFTPGRPVYIIRDSATIKNILLIISDKIISDNDCKLSAPLDDLLTTVSNHPNGSSSIFKY